ncbi:hypothetical protein CWO84_08005 [Methylomonas sp. Kb3]|uniref:hypothetical protein n=1 Tax=Methylomonas sp. Kb3 TaxID=1611544 RepID=UPI000C32A641|nr:hypothetical protein [Methylomonas sp. Kb3]PKD40810.1 hypothetical protein CWO84_08005 [Methylomonas sp. Kb3]
MKNSIRCDIENPRINTVYEAATFTIGVFLMLVMAGCSNSDDREKTKNLENGVVQIDINGHEFDVPLRYMYGETLEKWGNWPTAKKDRVKVDNLSLSMLLPELRPYYPEDDARWKVLGHGERINVTIMKPVGSAKWLETAIKITNDDVNWGRSNREGEQYGLAHFSEPWSDLYIATDSHSLLMHCGRLKDVPYPSCRVKSRYRENIVFEYNYGLNYLPQWREIDNNLKALFDQFSHSADTISNK